MNAHIATHLPGSHRFGRKQFVVAAFGAAVVLAAAAGIAAWQYERGGDDTAATAVQPASTHTDFTGRFDTMGGVADQTRDARLAESRAIGGVAEQLRDNASVATGSQAAGPRSDVPPFTVDRGTTVYLTDAQATADQQMSLIEEANAIRASMGLPPLDVDVIVITSAEQEAAIMLGLGDADAINAGMGLPGITVIDLRTPAGEAPTGISMDLAPHGDGPLFA